MAYVGMFIFVLAGVVYFLEPEVNYSSRDKVKALGEVMLLWSFMFYGYCRELEFTKSGVLLRRCSAWTALKEQSGILWLSKRFWRPSKFWPFLRFCMRSSAFDCRVRYLIWNDTDHQR
ncbi:hypothetical protein [Pseudomonas sp. RIT-PI-a]|uniref:hypothetical protein n=1 Tax=Pseudomonas sp. RIT-PI-a TaxID=1681194 RepID=UPI00128EE6B4|nr:hypothetical protein [Pseudomonas sp. RIT-PI-a]